MSEIEYQRKLLGDSVRNAAFHAALEQVIEPGVTTVADIGAGTGFLSFLARRLGARHCTLVEYSECLQLAESLAALNDIDGLDFVQEHSGAIEFTRPVDLIVSETLGHYALEENLLETLVDARRLLASGGVIMPCALRQFVAPVIHPRLQQDIDIWADIGYDLDYSAAREVALNNLYVKSIRPADLPDANSVRCWDEIDLAATAPVPSSQRGSQQRWDTALHGHRVHGFALWWEATLVAGVTLSTAPDAPTTHWQQVYLPLLDPIDMASGDRLQLQLDSDTGPDAGVRLSWTATHEQADGRSKQQRLDMDRGRL